MVTFFDRRSACHFDQIWRWLLWAVRWWRWRGDMRLLRAPVDRAPDAPHWAEFAISTLLHFHNLESNVLSLGLLEHLLVAAFESRSSPTWRVINSHAYPRIPLSLKQIVLCWYNDASFYLVRYGLLLAALRVGNTWHLMVGVIIRVRV
jgi:hypothetical protein